MGNSHFTEVTGHWVGGARGMVVWEFVTCHRCQAVFTTLLSFGTHTLVVLLLGAKEASTTPPPASGHSVGAVLHNMSL